jgi:hypothetical protein
MSELILTPQRERVQSCEFVANGVVVDLGTRQALVAAWPDERAAQRVAGLATRVLAVELFDLDGAARAELTAVWHRVPHTRTVSVPAALALAVSGVPAYVNAAAR